jgi:tetratricopeptide (TPR) repeat protein
MFGVMFSAAAPGTLALLLLVQPAASPPAQDDPALQAAVQRFFSTQEAEDPAAYLDQWSKTAKRPTLDQLKVVFESGDDKYAEIVVAAVRPVGDRVRVRVSAVRERTMPPREPGGPPRTMRSTSLWSLTFVREGEAWKLVSEGPAIDALAEDLIAAETKERRDELLAQEQELLGPELINALARRASAAAQQSLYRASQAAYERMRDVARAIGDGRAEGEALQNLANALYFQRDMAGALGYYEDRLALERSRDDAEGIAQSLLGIATIRYTFGEYGAALTAYRDALALQEKSGVERVIATTLISIGNILYLQGEYSAAIAEFTRSREISRRARDISGESKALEGMGRVLMAQGDYLGALEAFTDVLADARDRNSRSDQGAALLNLGDVHFRLGNLVNARAALDEARTHYEAVKDLAGAGRAWQAVALTDLVSDRFITSEEEYKKSAAICGTAGDRECAASAVTGLAFAQTAQEKFKEGIASYTSAIDAFTVLNRREQAARARVGLVQALLGSEAFDAAVATADRARSDAVALRNDDVLWRALTAQAAGLRRLRQREKAQAAATEAVAAVGRLVDVARMRPSAPVPRDSSTAFATLALLQAEAGDAAAAFDTVERMRAHDLRMTLAPGERDIARGMTDEEREEERAVSVELVSLHAQLTREQTLPKPDARRIDALQKRIAEASDRRTAQQDRLFGRLPALRIWRGLAPPATHADAARVFPDDQSLFVQLVVGEDTLLVLMARRQGSGVAVTAQFEPASRRTMATRVANLLNPESLGAAPMWKVLGNELIPGFAASLAGATRAIVVPHEVLWRVPFEALPTDTGYVADTCSIVYAPSLTALVNADAQQLTGPPLSLVPGSVVAVPAPALPPTVLDGVARTAPGWTPRTTDDSRDELNAVAAAIDAERSLVVAPDDATEALVRERLRFADRIHIAAPFRINGASPLFSPLLLAPDAGNDGTLEPRELMNLSLDARLTILSDGGAMSKRDSADQVASVAWAWRAAGVPMLMLPRWPSPPEASRTFLAALHERLRAGDTPETALNDARKRLRESGAPVSAWAAWLLLGR